MSYTKQTWDTTSYVNPTRMNHIEDGIKENSDNINSPAFTEAATRANINSGESLFTILGKIKKFFTDLKAVAFSGAASDVDYNNSQSGLSATKVQGAIDEVVGAIQTGTATFNLNAGQWSNLDVTFGKTFNSAPKVFTQVRGTYIPETEVSFATVTSVTTTGCTIRLKNNYSSALVILVDWVAIGF